MKKVVVLFTEDCKNLEMQCRVVHSHGALIGSFLPEINGAVIIASEEVVQKLKQHPAIQRIYPADGLVVITTVAL